MALIDIRLNGETTSPGGVIFHYRDRIEVRSATLAAILLAAIENRSVVVNDIWYRCVDLSLAV